MLFTLFLTFAKIGLFTFGDGYAVGWSDGGRVSDLVENASWCAPSNAVLPLRGTVTIAPFLYLTERQKLNFAPKK